MKRLGRHVVCLLTSLKADVPTSLGPQMTSTNDLDATQRLPNNLRDATTDNTSMQLAEPGKGPELPEEQPLPEGALNA